MEYVKLQLERDLIKELLENYTVDLDKERWKYIVSNETKEYLQSNPIDFNQLIKHRSYVDRRLFEMDETTCQARVWNEGYGGQCSRKKKFGDFCGKHNTKEKCWCGIISKPRPGHPVNTKGKIHTWKE
jgi:predicted nucleic acid binding AN1-type Zn finger protein|tara:strand:+ start:224 stop:607 length:384 start_codon:yes stop_codon:yes gene_type:complete